MKSKKIIILLLPLLLWFCSCGSVVDSSDKEAQSESCLNNFRIPEDIPIKTTTISLNAQACSTNVKGFGALGNGIDDDTEAVKKALASLSGGGCVYFLPGIYRITSEINIGSNTTLLGKDATILADLKGRYALKAEGTYGPAVPVTSDIHAGDTVVMVEKTDGILAGDLVQVVDLRNSEYYARQIATVSATSEDSITLYTPLSMPYSVDFSASIRKISGLNDIEIAGLTIEGSLASDITYLIYISNANGVTVRDTVIKNHKSSSSPDTVISIAVFQSDDVRIMNNMRYGVADRSLDNGNCIHAYATGKTLIDGNICHESAFGIGAWVGFGYKIYNNYITGTLESGNRGIKLAGSYFSEVAHNVVKGMDSGIKHQESGDNILRENLISGCGVASWSAGINLSNQYQPSIENQFGNIIIEKNYVKGQNGVGIYIDNKNSTVVVKDNIIESTGDSILSYAGLAQIENNCIVNSEAPQ